MKKMLYIGHAFHNKTKSSQFIKEILEKEYELEVFNFDPYTDSSSIFKELGGKKYDTVILWQIMPSINKLKKYIEWKHIAFFPMYDAMHDLKMPIWDEYRECNIINFSKTLHDKCKEYGLSSYYIKFFPKPLEISNYGDISKIFLWQREAHISPKLVKKVIGLENIKQLYWHKVPDPLIKIEEPSKDLMDKIKITEWFDTKEEMNDYMQECAIYFAPRKLEGIGMSFLEAMASGRCVIAPNYPTMNEYIKNGENGYLYNYKKPKKIKINDIRKIQKNTYSFIEKGYQEFEKNKWQILDWIESSPQNNSNKDLMDSKIYLKNPRKISITILKIIYTKKYKIFKLFNFLTIKMRRSSNI